MSFNIPTIVLAAASSACLSVAHAVDAISQDSSPTIIKTLAKKIDAQVQENLKQMGVQSHFSLLHEGLLARGDETSVAVERDTNSRTGDAVTLTCTCAETCKRNPEASRVVSAFPIAHTARSIHADQTQFTTSNARIDGLCGQDPTNEPSLSNPPPQASTSLRSSSSTVSFATAPNDSSRSSLARFGLRCDSPRPYPSPKQLPVPIPTRKPSPTQLTTSSGALSGIVASNRDSLGKLPAAPGIPFPTMPEVQVPQLIENTSHLRKILIIGSTYNRSFRKTNTMYSATTLTGVIHDVTQLTEVFKNCGYTVEQIGMELYDKAEVMTRVAEFVADAKRGDVRAIAFTGHGYKIEEGIAMLVPPDCLTQEDAITRDEWEDNIKTRARPGTIILSIMAHCYSGDFMRQEHDCLEWVSPQAASQSSSKVDVEQPIFITFASSLHDQYSFESTVDHRLYENVMDHFVYALVMTIKEAEVRTWQDFFANFKIHFSKARSLASRAHRYSNVTQNSDDIGQDNDGSLIEPFYAPLRNFTTSLVNNLIGSTTGPTVDSKSTLPWRVNNPQRPTFSASNIVQYSELFLPQGG